MSSPIGSPVPDDSAPDGASRGFPWPASPDESLLGAFFRTWRESVFSPSDFFRRLPVPGPVGPALIYYLVVGVLSAAFNLYWSTMARIFIGAPVATSEAGLEAWSPLLSFLFAPLGLFIVLGLVLIVVHLLLLLFGGARHGAQTTLRVLCFAYGPTVFSIVPILGGIVASVWVFVLSIIGLREAHQTDGWRAAVAVLLPLLLFIMAGVLIAIAATVSATRLL